MATPPCAGTARPSTAGARRVSGCRTARSPRSSPACRSRSSTTSSSSRTRCARFAEVQRDSLTDVEVETLPGVFLGHRAHPGPARPAPTSPAGSYPLTASAHMTILTAKVAGVQRVVACTPPIRGEIPAATVAAMQPGRRRRDLHPRRRPGRRRTGARHRDDRPGRPDRRPGQRLRRRGEAAALRRGRHRSVRRPDRDPRSSPTTTADPFLVAVDLLSQAEHGPESPAVLVTTCEALGREAIDHIERHPARTADPDYAEPAWRDYGQVIVVDDLDEAYRVADDFAFEHVQVLTAEPRRALDEDAQLRCAVPRREHLRLLR